MASIAFVADNTIPGLGASDLVRRTVDRISLGSPLAQMRSDAAQARGEVRLHRDLADLDARTLGDIGLDLSRQ